MIKEITYSFNEIDVNPRDINVLLGYADAVLPEPFSEYLKETMKKAETLSDLRGVFLQVN